RNPEKLEKAVRHLTERRAVHEVLERDRFAQREIVEAFLGRDAHQLTASSGRSTSSAPPTHAPKSSDTDFLCPSLRATSARKASASKPNFLLRSCSASSALQVRCKSPMKLSATPKPRVATARYTGSRPCAASLAISSSLRIPGKSRLLNWMTSGICLRLRPLSLRFSFRSMKDS